MHVLKKKEILTKCIFKFQLRKFKSIFTFKTTNFIFLIFCIKIHKNTLIQTTYKRPYECQLLIRKIKICADKKIFRKGNFSTLAIIHLSDVDVYSKLFMGQKFLDSLLTRGQ